METERRFEIELPDSGRIVWRFQGDVPVSRLKTLRRLIKPSAVAPASPVATEVSVRRRPFTEREEFGTAPVPDDSPDTPALGPDDCGGPGGDTPARNRG